MDILNSKFTLGIEEEYLLIDKDSRDLVAEQPPDFMKDCEKALGGQVTPEFLQCQVEVGTPICTSIAQARSHLSHLRCTIAEIAAKYNLAPLAVSTHPFATWTAQQHTKKERYDTLVKDLHMVARRMLICGMHVHVGIADKALRNDIFNQLPYFLPHLLALSTSSPFWQGRIAGLKSYRLSVFDELPRTGLPEQFDSYSEYDRTVEVMVNAGVIEDSTKIWWDLRPSAKFPTLEMRITDVCTRIDDTVAIAALYLCLIRMLLRLRNLNQRWRQYSRFLIMENRWRAQRYGHSRGLIDFGKGHVVPFEDLIEELIHMVREDAVELDCLPELLHIREIAKRGTSADRQLATFHSAIKNGGTEPEAFKRVVDQIARDTLTGCD